MSTGGGPSPKRTRFVIAGDDGALTGGTSRVVDLTQELYVSVHTVNTHVRNIYSKLGARDRSGAVRRARELRLLSTGHSRS